MQAVTRIATGSVLRWGEANFVLDGSFDGQTEEAHMVDPSSPIPGDVPSCYMKMDVASIVAMSQAERDAVDLDSQVYDYSHGVVSVAEVVSYAYTLPVNLVWFSSYVEVPKGLAPDGPQRARLRLCLKASTNHDQAFIDVSEGGTFLGRVHLPDTAGEWVTLDFRSPWLITGALDVNLYFTGNAVGFATVNMVTLLVERYQ